MEQENIYAPPKSNVEVKPTTDIRINLLRDLKVMSTWLLLFLSVITLGIYAAHYIRRQSTVINGYIDENRQISDWLSITILATAYVSVLLIIPYIYLEEAHPISVISNIMDRAFNIMLLIWAFIARSRMNILLNSAKGETGWFNAFWTFLFQQLYFNYKVNLLLEQQH